MKAQVSTFVIIGLILLLGIGVFLMRPSEQELDQEIQNAQEFSSFRHMVENMGESCLEELAEDAIAYYGFDTEKISDYVQEHIESCMEQEFAGFDIERGTPSVTVDTSGDAVLLVLTYPFMLTRADTSILVDKYTYDLGRIQYLEIGDGPQLLSGDGRAAIVLEGAQVSLDGDPVRAITLRITDTEEDGLSHEVVVGGTIYDAGPNGASFSQPVTLVIEYDEEAVPVGFDLSSLSIAWYDEEHGIWRSLPTQVDTQTHTLTATIDHFTDFAVVVGCNPKADTAESVLDVGYIYEQPFEACSQWTEMDGMLVSPTGYEMKQNSCDAKDYVSALPSAVYVYEDSVFSTLDACEAATPGPCEERMAYEQAEDIGGTGTFRFYLYKQDGDACIPDDQSLEDFFTVTITDEEGNLLERRGDMNATVLVELYDVDDAIGDVSVQVNDIASRSLSARYINEIEIEVLNTQGACASAKARLHFRNGIGVVPAGQAEPELQDDLYVCEGGTPGPYNTVGPTGRPQSFMDGSSCNVADVCKCNGVQDLAFCCYAKPDYGADWPTLRSAACCQQYSQEETFESSTFGTGDVCPQLQKEEKVDAQEEIPPAPIGPVIAKSSIAVDKVKQCGSFTYTNIHLAAGPTMTIQPGGEWSAWEMILMDGGWNKYPSPPPDIPYKAWGVCYVPTLAASALGIAPGERVYPGQERETPLGITVLEAPLHRPVCGFTHAVIDWDGRYHDFRFRNDLSEPISVSLTEDADAFRFVISKA